ncbi:hypothetical protein D1AOALGA4SA_12459 [Olavius algarvensis Delta 1 endosymbiont]|nr:hypothetical protein D1AOALGA4SA_12459 [Olavius algarvensis Delta 1 endosymbiont]
MDDNNPSTTFARLKKSCHSYARELMEISVRSILLLIFTAILSAVVIFFYEILWQIYQQTYKGQQFIMLYPETHEFILNFLKKDLIEVAIQVTVAAFTISIAVAAVCQTAYISRYLFIPLGLFTRILFWGIPLTIIVSMHLYDRFGFDHWSYSIPLAIVPTLCVFMNCFKFTKALLPEIGDVIANTFQFLKEITTLSPQQE